MAGRGDLPRAGKATNSPAAADGVGFCRDYICIGTDGEEPNARRQSSALGCGPRCCDRIGDDGHCGVAPKQPNHQSHLAVCARRAGLQCDPRFGTANQRHRRPDHCRRAASRRRHRDRHRIGRDRRARWQHRRHHLEFIRAAAANAQAELRSAERPRRHLRSRRLPAADRRQQRLRPTTRWPISSLRRVRSPAP